MADYEGKPWYYGPIDRRAVTALLEQDGGGKDGWYLVRKSTKAEGAFVISFFAQGRLFHNMVNQVGDVYKTAATQGDTEYPSLQAVIDHHKTGRHGFQGVLADHCRARPRPAGEGKDSAPPADAEAVPTGVPAAKPSKADLKRERRASVHQAKAERAASVRAAKQAKEQAKEEARRAKEQAKEEAKQAKMERKASKRSSKRNKKVSPSPQPENNGPPQVAGGTALATVVDEPEPAPPAAQGPAADDGEAWAADDSEVVVTLTRPEGVASWGIVGVGPDDSAAERKGVFVKSVRPGSPAEASGQLVQGQQILQINGLDAVFMTKREALVAMKESGPAMELVLVDNPYGYSLYDEGAALRRISMAAFDAHAMRVGGSTEAVGRYLGQMEIAKPSPELLQAAFKGLKKAPRKKSKETLVFSVQGAFLEGRRAGKETAALSIALLDLVMVQMSGSVLALVSQADQAGLRLLFHGITFKSRGAGASLAELIKARQQKGMEGVRQSMRKRAASVRGARERSSTFSDAQRRRASVVGDSRPTKGREEEAATVAAARQRPQSLAEGMSTGGIVRDSRAPRTDGGFRDWSAQAAQQSDSDRARAARLAGRDAWLPAMRSELGLPPAVALKTVLSQPLQQQPWFVGPASQEDIVAALAAVAPIGGFVVSSLAASAPEGALLLHVAELHHVGSYIIRVLEDGCQLFPAQATFPSVARLVVQCSISGLPGGGSALDLADGYAETSGALTEEERQEQEAAALRIQATYRGMRARAEAKERRQSREQHQAATRIQATYRGRLARQEADARRQQRQEAAVEAAEEPPAAAQTDIGTTEEQEMAATRIQAAFRGKQARDRVRQQQAEAARRGSGTLDEQPQAVDDWQAAGAKKAAAAREVLLAGESDDERQRRLAREAADAEAARQQAIQHDLEEAKGKRRQSSSASKVSWRKSGKMLDAEIHRLKATEEGRRREEERARVLAQEEAHRREREALQAEIERVKRENEAAEAARLAEEARRREAEAAAAAAAEAEAEAKRLAKQQAKEQASERGAAMFRRRSIKARKESGIRDEPAPDTSTDSTKPLVGKLNLAGFMPDATDESTTDAPSSAPVKVLLGAAFGLEAEASTDAPQDATTTDAMPDPVEAVAQPNPFAASSVPAPDPVEAVAQPNPFAASTVPEAQPATPPEEEPQLVRSASGKRLPRLAKVDHSKFASERERLEAEADVDATQSRLNDISFDFTF